MEKFLKRPFIPTPEDNLDDLPWDPAKRKKITAYHSNQRDEVRRKYLARGPCKPYGHNFLKKMIGKSLRRFSPAWFDQYGNWLEYSVRQIELIACVVTCLEMIYINKAGMIRL